jgi:hypothetical protein
MTESVVKEKAARSARSRRLCQELVELKQLCVEALPLAGARAMSLSTMLLGIA